MIHNLIMKMLSLQTSNRIELVDDFSQSIKTKKELFINGKNKMVKTIDVLNKPVKINNDRIEGFQTASRKTEDPVLISLFKQFFRKSEKCKQKLVSEIVQFGDILTQETKKSGIIYRTWMEINLSVTGNDRISLLNSCNLCKPGKENEPEKSKEVWKDDLKYLRVEQITPVNSQFALIGADHIRQHSIIKAQKVINN